MFAKGYILDFILEVKISGLLGSFIFLVLPSCYCVLQIFDLHDLGLEEFENL